MKSTVQRLHRADKKHFSFLLRGVYQALTSRFYIRLHSRNEPHPILIVMLLFAAWCVDKIIKVSW